MDGVASAQGDGSLVVRLRVSFKGRFVQGEGGDWRYVGGDHFLESLPDTTRYADVMFSLSEKVDDAVSVKYQLPGEELDPDSLISVNDDNDIKELFHEYMRALRMPGTPVKTFRLRLFLFPAAEDPYTPEDLAYFSSRTSSADKLGRELAGASSGGGGGGARDSSLTKAFSKVAAAATPSSFSSDLSSGSAPDHAGGGGGGGSPDGTVTPSGPDADLAWELGFRAGQEAAAIAAKEEWQAVLAKRMQYLGHVQSDWMLNAAEAGAAAWHEEHCGSPWDGSMHAASAAAHSMQMQSSGMYGTAAGSSGAGLGALDDIDYDPDAEEAAEAAEEAAAEARWAAASRTASLANSRQPSPRAAMLSGAMPPPQPPMSLPALLHPHPLPVPPAGTLLHPSLHPQLAVHHRSASLLDSPLAPQTSVVMEDVETDAEFQSMFESKYEAAAAVARRSPSVPYGLDSSGGGAARMAQAAAAAPQWGSGPAAARGSGSMHGSGSSQAAAAAGGTTGGAAAQGGRGSAAILVKQPARGMAAAAGSGASLAASPNSLLPTHISVFGDGVSGLDMRRATAVGRPAVHLPSHISEFGGDEEGTGEDAEQCRDRDANTMSVMKAALPDDDDQLADAMDALRRSPLPPDAVQLPTSFELLGGAAGAPPPRRSPGLAAAAGGNGGLGAGGGGGAGAGALPSLPSDLQRSASLEELLSKVQRIDSSQVDVLAKIGEGAFGEVSLAQCPTYGRVAVKWIKPTKVERHWSSFWHEAELMSRLNHPNVLRFFGLVVEGPMVVGIMTEFAAAGSLASHLRSGVGFIPLKQRAQLALHAVNGMAYLHSLKVVHFDVKPDNLLVDGDWLSDRTPVVKVADFGLSKHKYNTFCSNVHDLRGTLPYMAPEMIMDHTHVTEKADVWSLGVVFWEMLTLEVPFADMPPAQLIGALGLGKLRLSIPEWCEPDWRALMESCWVEDPTMRPSCRQLATHLERIRDLAH